MGAGKSRGARSMMGFIVHLTDIRDPWKLGRDRRRDLAGAACKMGNGLAGMLNTTMYYTAIHDIGKTVATNRSHIDGLFFFFLEIMYILVFS